MRKRKNQQKDWEEWKGQKLNVPCWDQTERDGCGGVEEISVHMFWQLTESQFPALDRNVEEKLHNLCPVLVPENFTARTTAILSLSWCNINTIAACYSWNQGLLGWWINRNTSYRAKTMSWKKLKLSESGSRFTCCRPDCFGSGICSNIVKILRSGTVDNRFYPRTNVSKVSSSIGSC